VTHFWTPINGTSTPSARLYTENKGMKIINPFFICLCTFLYFAVIAWIGGGAVG